METTETVVIRDLRDRVVYDLMNLPETIAQLREDVALRQSVVADLTAALEERVDAILLRLPPYQERQQGANKEVREAEIRDLTRTQRQELEYEQEEVEKRKRQLLHAQDRFAAAKALARFLGAGGE